MTGVYGYEKCPKCGGKAASIFESSPVVEQLLSCLECKYINHAIGYAGIAELDEQYKDQLASGKIIKTRCGNGFIYEGFQK